MNAEGIGKDWVGRVVNGKYTLQKWLGSAGTSAVFLTTLPEPSSRLAAIKLIPAGTAFAEARLAAWAAAEILSHPHLMPISDSGRCQIDDTPLLYAVTEYAEEDLSQILPDRPLTPAEASEMLGPVLNTLAYLHGKGLVHGHLKPSNILVVDDQLKLSSDSLETVGGTGALRQPSTVYDAPERATEPISPAVDIWSLGVTLVEALTQHPPAWEAGSSQDPGVPESLPQPFAEIAQQCLRHDPRSRYTLEGIQARLHGKPLPAQPHMAEKPTPAPPQKAAPEAKQKAAPARPRAMLMIGSILVALAVVAALILQFHGRRHAPPAGSHQPAPQAAAPSPQPSIPAPPAAPAVTVKAQVAHQVLPTVPQSASDTIIGTLIVIVRVDVDPGGNVTNATFDFPGPSKYFAKLSMEAAQKWTFKPAQVNGQPAPSAWLLRFEFTNTSTNAVPTEVSP